MPYDCSENFKLSKKNKKNEDNQTEKNGNTYAISKLHSRKKMFDFVTMLQIKCNFVRELSSLFLNF